MWAPHLSLFSFFFLFLSPCFSSRRQQRRRRSSPPRTVAATSPTASSGGDALPHRMRQRCPRLPRATPAAAPFPTAYGGGGGNFPWKREKGRPAIRRGKRRSPWEWGKGRPASQRGKRNDAHSILHIPSETYDRRRKRPPSRRAPSSGDFHLALALFQLFLKAARTHRSRGPSHTIPKNPPPAIKYSS
uniref:Uncharacterized protein n=1 Tax=Oryza rufipogon TaxID=4529 RepID=A0A0E0N3V6_ORYRU